MIKQSFIEAAEILLPAPDLQPTLDFFSEKLGFRLLSIFPADAPHTALMTGHGIRLRFESGYEGPPGCLRLLCDGLQNPGIEKQETVAPNGTRLVFAEANPPLVIPELEPSLVLNFGDDGSKWHTGRAGMQYRDLIPDRQGGRFIVSHIRIPEGGPVPDYVHHHKIHFQMIFCYKGWVKVVYEDQGPQFVMNSGDCVLQPPHIRHQVLECSDGLEVIEVSCPAEHETYTDHLLELPNSKSDPSRNFSGQRFLFFQGEKTAWEKHPSRGLFRDTGIGSATHGIADVRVLRPDNYKSNNTQSHQGELLFYFVLKGSMELNLEEQGSSPFKEGDSASIPTGMNYSFGKVSENTEILEVHTPLLNSP